MDECSLVTNNGITVYQSDVDLYTAEYIDSLPDPEMIYKTATFTGLLEYLHRKLIKPVVKREYSYNYNALDDIFYNIYIPLVTKYGFTPSIIQFCTLVKIDNGNLTDVKNGFYRGEGERVNKNHTQIVKKWYNTCESSLLSRAVDTNSIGSIFALKSVYQYNDSQTIRIEQDITPQHDTAAEIAARHSAALLPEKPDLNDW